MEEWPTNEYVEVRNGAYYVVGTRIGLDIIIDAYRQGECAENIFESFPSIGSLARVYGAIAFILEHPDAVHAYLEDQDRAWEEFKRTHPLPPGTEERFQRWLDERVPKL